MKKKFIDNCYNFITNYEDCDDLKTKKIRYGLETIYNLLTKLIVLTILTLWLNIFKDFILLVVCYSLARRYAYGLHAKTSIACWITTLPIYLLGCYIIHYVSIPNYLVYSLWSFSFLSFLLWAPADTPQRPLIHENIRKKQKIKACTICLIYLLLIGLQISFVTSACIYSLLIQSICINPITYKLTHTPFDNYKIYGKTHGLNY